MTSSLLTSRVDLVPEGAFGAGDPEILAAPGLVILSGPVEPPDDGAVRSRAAVVGATDAYQSCVGVAT